MLFISVCLIFSPSRQHAVEIESRFVKIYTHSFEVEVNAGILVTKPRRILFRIGYSFFPTGPVCSQIIKVISPILNVSRNLSWQRTLWIRGGKKVGLYHNKDNDLKGLSKNEHNG